MKNNPWPIKNFSTLLSNAVGDFLAAGTQETQIMTNLNKLKNVSSIKKLVKFVMLKRRKPFYYH